MAAPIPFVLSTARAPFGWFIIGPKKKKLAHFWEGRDKKIHAFLFREDSAPIPAGPWDGRPDAEKALVALLTPRGPRNE